MSIDWFVEKKWIGVVTWITIYYLRKHHKVTIVMNIKKVVRQAKQANPNELGKLGNQKAISLLREVFRQIHAEIAEKNAGVVKVGGLGVFRIKEVEVEKEGNKKLVKRVRFVPRAGREKSSEQDSDEPDSDDQDSND